MTTTIKSYSVSKIKTLIDLNHDMINFKVQFSLTSESPFYAIIVNQDTLDNTESDTLEYRYVEDTLTGEVVADKNVYQNYYIILKADRPTNVQVELYTTRLPDVINSRPIQSYTPSHPSPHLSPHPSPHPSSHPSPHPSPRLSRSYSRSPDYSPDSSPSPIRPPSRVKTSKKSQSGMTMTYLLYFFVIAFIAILFYFFYYKKKQTEPITCSNTSLLQKLKMAHGTDDNASF